MIRHISRMSITSCGTILEKSLCTNEPRVLQGHQSPARHPFNSIVPDSKDNDPYIEQLNLRTNPFYTGCQDVSNGLTSCKMYKIISEFEIDNNSW